MKASIALADGSSVHNTKWPSSRLSLVAKRFHRVWLVPPVDRAEDLWVKPDVGVVVPPARQPIRSNIDLPKAMHSNEEHLCLITHGQEVPSDALQEQRLTTKVVHICMSYLDVGLDEHH